MKAASRLSICSLSSLALLALLGGRALAAASDKDKMALLSLSMAGYVDDRCHLLSPKERARLDQMFEYGIKQSHLSPDEEQVVREHDPDYDKVDCDSSFVSTIFEGLMH